ncbi:hypothetical protein RRG08_020812 [Elysia crispata]|uniref:OTU domain-containing protein n=1 Tax=Elysia crispata TaxID=231223 RepID=A0AAE1D311_9GAST|nr:hypothetical protein RRG08_020812 [Elysia crispata]
MTEKERLQIRKQTRARQKAFRQCLCEVCLNPMLKVKVLNKKLPESKRLESLRDIEWVSEWKSVKEWERACKYKVKLQQQIVSERENTLNNAFLKDDIGLEHLFPVYIDSDGNCMLRSTNLALFCTEEHHVEIKSRICIESVLNKNHYLNLPHTDFEMLRTLSECEGDNISDIFQDEIMSVCRLGTYMVL